MPDRTTTSRTFIVHFKEEVDAQWAATVLGAASPRRGDRRHHRGRDEALLRKLQARIASATSQQR